MESFTTVPFSLLKHQTAVNISLAEQLGQRKKKIEEGGEIKNIKRQGMDEDRGIISCF